MSAYDGINISYLDIEIRNITTYNVDENSYEAFTIVAINENPLEYSISGEDSAYFNVNSSTGIVTFKTLSDVDHTTKRSYSLTLVVTDNITPSKVKTSYLI